MHVATMNNWEDIVEELISFAKRDNLLKETELLTLVVIGSEASKLTSTGRLTLPHSKRKRNKGTGRPKNIKIVSGGRNLLQYEGPTIKELWKKCNSVDEEFYVYYIHTKGASYGPNPKSDSWRREMAEFILGNWRRCVEQLDLGRDTCGIKREKDHYAGNFWWAKASYIRTLERPKRTRNRFYYENWLNVRD